ncbi:MAG TPA: hypothetical protein PKX93_09370 [bacterium]|nr:hypothetical protein [bacterium]HOL67651.1 hypothetical protein [bacterium]HPP12485.1 hypothetical protein [bacterium]
MYAEELEKLVLLQELDIEIAELEEQLAAIPQKIEEWRQKFKKEEEQLALLRKEHQRLKVDRREQEGELRAIEEEIARLQKVLDQVKTNKEYTSVLSEIQRTREKQSLLENQVLELMEKDDDFSRREKELLSLLERYQQEISVKEQQEKQRAGELKALLEQKQTLRREKTGQIEFRLLSLYERIRENKKDGVAVCRLVTDGDRASCSGCSVFVPVYLAEKVKKRVEVATCENCSRILY